MTVPFAAENMAAAISMLRADLDSHVRTIERLEGYLKACLPYLSDNPDMHQPGAELLADSIKSELKL